MTAVLSFFPFYRLRKFCNLPPIFKEWKLEPGKQFAQGHRANKRVRIGTPSPASLPGLPGLLSSLAPCLHCPKGHFFSHAASDHFCSLPEPLASSPKAPNLEVLPILPPKFYNPPPPTPAADSLTVLQQTFRTQTHRLSAPRHSCGNAGHGAHRQAEPPPPWGTHTWVLYLNPAFWAPVPTLSPSPSACIYSRDECGATWMMDSHHSSQLERELPTPVPDL